MLVLLFSHAVLAEPKVDSVSLEPNYVQAGEDVEVYIKISEALVARQLYSQVSGDGGIPVKQDKNIRYVGVLTPKDDYAGRQVIIKNPSKNIGHLFTGESWTIPYTITILDDTAPGDLKLEFRVLRNDVEPNELMIAREIIIPVQGNVMFSTVSDNKLSFGENKVKVEVENVGGGVARQTMASLESLELITVTGSNTIFLSDFAHEDRKTAEFTVFVDSKASLGAYSLPMTLSYLERDGSRKTKEFMLGLQLDAEPQIHLNAEARDRMGGGSSGTVTVNVVNNGLVDVEFVDLELLDTEHYSVVGANRVYVGKIDSDDTEREDFTIKVSDGVDMNSLTLKAKLYYTKENSARKYSMEYAPAIKIFTNEELRMNGETSTVGRILGLILLVIVLVAGYFALWILLNVIWLVKSIINRKLFKRGRS